MSIETMFATEFPEFFYEDTNELVQEGEHIGFDIATDDGVELTLLDNIYWSPQFDEE